MNTAGDAALDRLPVIDVTDLGAHDPDTRRNAVESLRLACERHGFFYVANHGVPQGVIDAALGASRAFFSLPEAEKMRVDKANSKCSRGYEPLRGQTLEPGSSPDVKEGFYFGVDLPPDDPRVLAGTFSLGPNQVPAEPADFGSAMQRYHAELRALATRIMQGLALSLALPQTHFDDFSAGVMAIVRLLHYPPQPANPLPGEKGCGEHTDFGGITVLLQDDAGGLQVWSEALGRWIDAPPVPGTFVVNLGDMMGQWTNDKYRSTLHRVINRSGKERYSIPFFLSGDPDMPLECLPTCTDANRPPRYQPTTVSRHFRMKFEGSYGK